MFFWQENGEAQSILNAVSAAHGLSQYGQSQYDAVAAARCPAGPSARSCRASLPCRAARCCAPFRRCPPGHAARVGAQRVRMRASLASARRSQVSAIDTCLREEPGRFKCSTVQVRACLTREQPGGFCSSGGGDFAPVKLSLQLAPYAQPLHLCLLRAPRAGRAW
jgi:hypothetical protein